jgi:hypothetical protein
LVFLYQPFFFFLKVVLTLCTGYPSINLLQVIEF